MAAIVEPLIERQVYVAPFGLGLWDAAAGRLVADALSVQVFRLAGDRAASPVTAQANRSGIFAAHGLQALHAFEAGGAVAPQLHRVAVRDEAGRFLPFITTLSLPAPQGIALPACHDALWPAAASLASPPARGAWLPLFPGPAYAAPAGTAVLRAACVDDADGEPAANVVIEIGHGGRLLARAVSDARGEALAVFPYPEPPGAPVFSPGSPPGPPAPATPLADTTWPLEIAVRWRRDLPLYVTDRERAPLPDLCALLTQPSAEASDDASPPMPLRDATLRHGRDLVLADGAGARLRIRPA